MNLSFKKRWLYIFSNKKAQAATGTGMTARQLIILIVTIMIIAALFVIVFKIPELIQSYSP